MSDFSRKKMKYLSFPQAAKISKIAENNLTLGRVTTALVNTLAESLRI
jgi:hypothetical protein